MLSRLLKRVHTLIFSDLFSILIVLLAARQISTVEKSTCDVIVYIEGRSGYIIGHYRRSLKIILFSQALC
jgi:hypothetical protein